MAFWYQLALELTSERCQSLALPTLPSCHITDHLRKVMWLAGTHSSSMPAMAVATELENSNTEAVPSVRMLGNFFLLWSHTFQMEQKTMDLVLASYNIVFWTLLQVFKKKQTQTSKTKPAKHPIGMHCYSMFGESLPQPEAPCKLPCTAGWRACLYICFMLL